jgi:hypothetical protein
MNATMASVGTNVLAPACAPSQFLFDAVDDLSKIYLSETWTGSIKFRCLLVHALSTGLSLDKTCTREVDICDYLGVSPSHPPYVIHLFLDPEKYDKPPLPGEHISKNPHWMQLKDALELAAHTSGSPIMCNGGMDYRRFKCKLRKRVYKLKLGKKDGVPGKMIASTWTRVADARMEGLNQREPAPRRHSQVTNYVLSDLLSNGIILGSTSH